MIRYIALLRGINVTGHNLLKMDALRASFTRAGFVGSKTYLQSGNVVFAAEESRAALGPKIEKLIQRDFSLTVRVWIVTGRELGEVVKNNPFITLPKVDTSRLHATFLSDEAPSNGQQLLEPLVTEGERVRVAGRVVYLYCPNGYGTSKLGNTAVEKKLTRAATTRNWNTTRALLALVEEE